MQSKTINGLLLLVATFGCALIYAQDQDCVPDTDGCGIGCPCFSFTMVEFSAVDETSTSITFEVVNNCKMEVSYVAIGTGNLTVLSPQDGSTYQSDSVTYSVNHMQLSGNPGFPSVKFSRLSGSHCCGISQTFTLVFVMPASQMSMFNFRFQGHAGTVWDSAGPYQSAACDCTDCEPACPPGFGGTDCASCADPASTPGYSYWCVPQDSALNPYTLQLLPCSNEAGNCPPDGFSPFSTNVDTDGYTVTCDCERVTHECPNSCSGNGYCDEATGTCNCVQGAQPDCSLPPAVGPTCQTYQNCSGNGICNSGYCNCSQGFEGPSCDSVPPQTCSDFNECQTCSDSSLGCAWCDDGFGNVACTNTSACPATNQVSPCTPGTIVYQHEPCPDECSGHGKCENGDCHCDSGWTGVNCSQPSSVALGAGIGAAVLSLIVVGAIVGLVVSGGGSYAAYKKLRNEPLFEVQMNPLYNDAGLNGVNPMYQEPKTTV